MESSYNSNSHLHDRQDRDEYERDEPEEIDREISLGTSTILGIFFALALVCAVFFGFGYTMGRHSVPVAAAAEPGVPGTASNTPKPTSASQTPAREVPESEAHIPKAAPAEKPIAKSVPLAAPVATVTVAPPVASSTQATGTFNVQIAAVSHREDAEILLTTLGRRGYNVTVRQEPQDKLLHVQIGNFPTRKDADAMRLRLLADGYNAIVK